MYKSLSAIFLLISLSNLALSYDYKDYDRYPDATYKVCSGLKNASDYFFHASQMRELKELEGYREMAKELVRQHPRLSWFNLTPSERCQVTRNQERSANVREYFDKRSLGIGGN